jgi:hypothetical protein
MKRLLLCLLTAAPLCLAAQNPIIRDQFTADPTARVFNGKVYLYPSHDIMPPEGQRQDWFCMADYHVFSTEDLTDWTDHGVIVTQENVPWGNPTGYAMWAPDCVYKKSAAAPEGRYYFYFPNAPKGTRGFAIGVATADSPTGPFTLEPEPIKGVMGIDPCVLIDDDGQSYIYWSGMGIRGAKLRENMKEVDDIQPMEGLPEGFKEGPFAFKRNGWYYLTFPWVRGDKSNGANPTETLAYAMARSPLGPWDFKGIIMAEHSNHCWTNHHSLLEYQGQWYLFYHHNPLSPRDDKRRSVCIEKVTFNPDGTIQEVKPTMRGVGTNKATEKIEVDRYSQASDDVTVGAVDTTNYMRGGCALLPKKGSWLRYADVDFSVVTDGYVVISAKANANTELCLREKGAKGKVIARVTLPVKNEQGRFRRDMSGQWLTLTAPLEYTPKGKTDIVVTCEGLPAAERAKGQSDESLCVDWVQFKNRPKYFTPASAQPAQPDAQGFIRRWMLLEPIRQDIRSNIVFTNSWLRDAFTKTYFKDQMTMVPGDGQKVKAGKQTLAWHALDSENYNMKLFRFAEKYGDQTYGSLFWAYTVIDCEEDISNVRLAAGSNGASIWWLNGEEVLLLEGDRRMVVDDGMSPRLTLKKGRNVLRCAVINGPGLSDMCARFIHEKGTPVTSYKVTISK